MTQMLAFLVLLLGGMAATTALAAWLAERRRRDAGWLVRAGLATIAAAVAGSVILLPLVPWERLYTLGALLGAGFWLLAHGIGAIGVALVAGAILATRHRVAERLAAAPQSRWRTLVGGLLLVPAACVGWWIAASWSQALPVMVASGAIGWWLACAGVAMAMGAMGWATRSPSPGAVGEGVPRAVSDPVVARPTSDRGGPAPATRRPGSGTMVVVAVAAAVAAVALTPLGGELRAWLTSPGARERELAAALAAAEAPPVRPTPPRRPSALSTPPADAAPTVSSPAPAVPKADALVADARPSPGSPDRASPPVSGTRALALRSTERGRRELRVDEAWLRAFGRDIEFRIDQACRYDPADDRWVPVDAGAGPREGWIKPVPSGEPIHAERLAYALPEPIGLYWIRWHERTPRSPDPGASREALVASGPAMCNDLMLGPSPAGRVAACVPMGETSASARFVPVPGTAAPCR